MTKTYPDRTVEEAARKAGAAVQVLWEVHGPKNTGVAWLSALLIGSGLCIVETFKGGGWEALTANGGIDRDATIADVLARCHGRPRWYSINLPAEHRDSVGHWLRHGATVIRECPDEFPSPVAEVEGINAILAQLDFEPEPLPAADPPAIRYCVDGIAPDGTYQGDGEGAPFRIFDIEAQHNLPGDYATRADAEAVLRLIHPKARTAAALVQEAIDNWPEFDGQESVSGSDLVEWFGDWRDRAKVAVA